MNLVLIIAMVCGTAITLTSLTLAKSNLVTNKTLSNLSRVSYYTGCISASMDISAEECLKRATVHAEDINETLELADKAFKEYN